MADGLRRRDALHLYMVRGGGVNMAPMVDVVLVILIFFMAATKFAGEEWLLRSGAQHDGQEGLTVQRTLPGVVLSVRVIAGEKEEAERGQGYVALVQGSQRVELGLLEGWLSGFLEGIDASSVSVVIDGADEVSWEAVVRAHEACLGAGIERVAIGA